MKYLKKFEKKYYDKEYWAVYSEPYYLRKALKKIDYPDYHIDDIIKNLGEQQYYRTIYVSITH